MYPMACWLWTVYGIVACWEGVVGWLLSPLINRLLAGFFRGFQLVLRAH